MAAEIQVNVNLTGGREAQKTINDIERAYQRLKKMLERQATIRVDGTKGVDALTASVRKLQEAYDRLHVAEGKRRSSEAREAFKGYQERAKEEEKALKLREKNIKRNEKLQAQFEAVQSRQASASRREAFKGYLDRAKEEEKQAKEEEKALQLRERNIKRQEKIQAQYEAVQSKQASTGRQEAFKGYLERAKEEERRAKEEEKVLQLRERNIKRQEKIQAQYEAAQSRQASTGRQEAFKGYLERAKEEERRAKEEEKALKTRENNIKRQERLQAQYEAAQSRQASADRQEAFKGYLERAKAAEKAAAAEEKLANAQEKAKAKRASADAKEAFKGYLERAKAAEKAAAAEEKLAAAQRKMGDSWGTVNAGQATNIAAMTQYIRAQEGMENATVRATGAIRNSVGTFQTYSVSTNVAGQATQNYRVAVNTTTGEVYALDKGVKTATVSMGNMGRVALSFVKQIVGFYGAAQSIRYALKEMKSMSDEMIVYQKVTKATDLQMEQIRKQSYATAKAYGQTPTDFLSAAQEMARAGYGEQASAMADLAVKTKLVGDITAEEASKFLLAVDAGYKYGGSIEQLSHVLDMANEVGNNYATSIGKISEGMTLVASLAGQANIPIEQLIAALGTMTAATQRSGSEMARALRFITLGILGDTVTEVEEGVTVTAEEVDSLTKALQYYAPEVVEAAKASGQLINPMEAIASLAKAYKSGLITSQEELFSISKAIAGQRYYNAFAALIENYDTLYLGMLEKEKNAAGSADAEIKKLIQSWSSKFNILKTQWVQMVDASINEGFIKSLIEGSTAALEFAGSLENLAGAALGAYAAFKSLKAGLAGMKEAGGSISGFGAGNWFGIGAGVAIAGISAWKAAYEKSIKDAQEAGKKALQTATKESSGVDDLESIRKKYLDIVRDGIQKEKGEVSQLKTLQSELNNLVGDQAKAVDMVNGKYDDTLEKLRQMTEEQRQAALISARASLSANVAAFKQSDLNGTWQTGLTTGVPMEYNKAIEEYLKNSKYFRVFEGADGFPMLFMNKKPEKAEEIVEFYKEIKDFYDFIGTHTKDGEKATKDMKSMGEEFSSMYTALGKFVNLVKNANVDEIEESVNLINELEKAAEKAAEKVRLLVYTGNVNLSKRKKVPVSALEKAGWGKQTGDYATVFSQTYSGGDKSKDKYDYSMKEDVVFTVTPILPNGKVLSQSELEKYLDGLIKGGADTKEKLLAADKKSRGLIMGIADVIDGDLSLSYKKMDEWAENVHKEQAKMYDDYMTLAKAIDEATKAKEKFDDAMKKTKADEANAYTKAFKTYKDELKKGRVNSTAFYAAARMLLGDEVYNTTGGSSAKVRAAMNKRHGSGSAQQAWNILSGTYKNKAGQVIEGAGIWKLLSQTKNVAGLNKNTLTDKNGNMQIPKLSDKQWGQIAAQWGVSKGALLNYFNAFDQYNKNGKTTDEKTKTQKKKQETDQQKNTKSINSATKAVEDATAAVNDLAGKLGKDENPGEGEGDKGGEGAGETPPPTEPPTETPTDTTGGDLSEKQSAVDKLNESIDTLMQKISSLNGTSLAISLNPEASSAFANISRVIDGLTGTEGYVFNFKTGESFEVESGKVVSLQTALASIDTLVENGIITPEFGTQLKVDLTAAVNALNQESIAGPKVTLEIDTEEAEKKLLKIVSPDGGYKAEIKVMAETEGAATALSTILSDLNILEAMKEGGHIPEEVYFDVKGNLQEALASIIPNIQSVQEIEQITVSLESNNMLDDDTKKLLEKQLIEASINVNTKFSTTAGKLTDIVSNLEALERMKNGGSITEDVYLEAKGNLLDSLATILQSINGINELSSLYVSIDEKNLLDDDTKKLIENSVIETSVKVKTEVGDNADKIGTVVANLQALEGMKNEGQISEDVYLEAKGNLFETITSIIEKTTTLDGLGELYVTLAANNLVNDEIDNIFNKKYDALQIGVGVDPNSTTTYKQWLDGLPKSKTITPVINDSAAKTAIGKLTATEYKDVWVTVKTTGDGGGNSGRAGNGTGGGSAGSGTGGGTPGGAGGSSGVGSGSGASGWDKPRFNKGYATGTNSFSGGAALVNDGAGPELIVNRGRAFIAGGGKPTVVNLDKGAKIFTATETRNILNNGGMPSFAGGTDKVNTGQQIDESKSKNKNKNKSSKSKKKSKDKDNDYFSKLQAMVDYIINRIGTAVSEQIKVIDEQIANLQKERQLQKQQNELAEKQKAVADAQKDLQDAMKERTVRYLGEDGKWHWQADARKVKSAQENLDKAKKDLKEYKEEQAFNKKVEKLENKKTKLQNNYDTLSKQWSDIVAGVNTPTGTINKLLNDVMKNGTKQEKEGAKAIQNVLLKNAKSGKFSGNYSEALRAIAAATAGNPVMPGDTSTTLASLIAGAGGEKISSSLKSVLSTATAKSKKSKTSTFKTIGGTTQNTITNYYVNGAKIGADTAKNKSLSAVLDELKVYAGG